MKNKVINIALSYGMSSLFVAFMILFSFIFIHEHLDSPIVILFFAMLIFSLIPIISYFQNVIDYHISPINKGDVYLQTVDSILKLESQDEFLKETFDQILKIIRVNAGLLIFYDHDVDEFRIFYQKNKRQKIIRKAKISQDNIIFKIISGPEDIIIRSRLDPGMGFEGKIIEELEKLNGGIVVPIFYHKMFLGIIVAGDRKRKFSDREIKLLKIFASRIASLTVNRFFFSEIIKKKQLEKEMELANRVQKKFLPRTDQRFDNLSLTVHHKPSSLMIREYFDVFQNAEALDDIRVSTYRIMGDFAGTSILMPGVQAVLQSFSRLKYQPAEAVKKLKLYIKQKQLVDEELQVLHGRIKQNGEFIFAREGYIPPFLYSAKRKKVAQYRRNGKDLKRIRLSKGDILILAGNFFGKIIEKSPDNISRILQENKGIPISKIKPIIIRELRKLSSTEKEDELLILVAAGENKE